jgi:threonine dehydrogenase-like Zn-dependent dehydrogenase
MTGGFPGGQAEYVRVPFGEVNLLKVPKELSGRSSAHDDFAIDVRTKLTR